MNATSADLLEANSQDASLSTPENEPQSSSLQFTFATCCLCGIDDCAPVAVGEDFEYRTSVDEFLMVRCRSCGLVYLNPRPADSEMSRIYPNNYHAFEFKPAEFGFVYRVRRWLEARRLLRWCRHLPQQARILDVGCGDGFHLNLLRDFGKPDWQLEGVDIDSRAIAAASKLGITVHEGSVEQLPLPEQSYHLILMIMTIEHLANPTKTLRAVAKLLAPGGRVVIVTDNVGSPDFRIFGGRHWGGFHFPRHTYLFNKHTIHLLATAAGLKVERVQTALSPVNWVYSFRNWIDDWRGPRWLVNWLSLKSVLPLAWFTLLDMPLSLIGKGAILHATFIRPETSTERLP
jgi:SAM-dependent methyltransferase